jgi:hypothetical protein
MCSDASAQAEIIASKIIAELEATRPYASLIAHIVGDRLRDYSWAIACAGSIGGNIEVKRRFAEQQEKRNGTPPSTAARL